MAKSTILAAKNAGADMVKMQAIDPDVVYKSGSMPYSFYKECELTTEEYAACVEYGKEIGLEVFFSIFGTKHKILWEMFPKSYRKISGGQFTKMLPEELAQYPLNTIVSIPTGAYYSPNQKKALGRKPVMMVTPYLPKAVAWDYLEKLRGDFPQVGYSDHTPGVSACKKAIGEYGCRLIEKHFHLGTDIVWEGQRYRDCLHAVTPDEFSKLAKYFSTFR